MTEDSGTPSPNLSLSRPNLKATAEREKGRERRRGRERVRGGRGRASHESTNLEVTGVT